MVEIFVYSAIILWPIVNYNLLGYSELANYILPNKLNDFFFFDGGEGLSFYPFAEIFGGNQ